MSKPFPTVTVEAWRAQVDKELAGASFDKALVTTTIEGIAVQPLYTEAAPDGAGFPGRAPFTRGARVAPGFAVVPRADARAGAIAEELEGGADGVWVELAGGSVDAVAELPAAAPLLLGGASDALATVAALAALPGARERAVGLLHEASAADAAAVAAAVRERLPRGRALAASGLAAHQAGAHAAEELGAALASGVAGLRALTAAGWSVADAAAQIGFVFAVARDTFMEVAKLRAARLTWHKVLAAAGAPSAPMAHLAAIGSTRTLAQRDPWTNLLRTTTQVFAAVLGGADTVTPLPFDAALPGAPGELGRRMARNTALILREESHLGRVVDPAGGSYYLEALTDALARAAWKVFQELERDPAARAALGAATWTRREELLRKRREPVLGVSDFANPGEVLPRPAGAAAAPVPGHRDAAPFERLRDAVDAASARPTVTLATLGPLAEHKARAAFARGVFEAAGFAVDERPAAEAAAASPGPRFACLCGSDERYAAEAAAAARALAAAGARKLLVAGRPGALEKDLKDAGVTGFVFVGADLVSALGKLVAEVTS